MGGAGAHALSARPPALQRAGVCASRGQGRSSPLPPALGPRHFRTLRPCQHVDDSASRASAPSAPEASERAGPVGRRNATGDGRGAAFLHAEGLRPLAAAWAGASSRTLARVSGLEQSEARALAALRRRAVAVRAESGARTPVARPRCGEPRPREVTCKPAELALSTTSQGGRSDMGLSAASCSVR